MDTAAPLSPEHECILRMLLGNPGLGAALADALRDDPHYVRDHVEDDAMDAAFDAHAAGEGDDE